MPQAPLFVLGRFPPPLDGQTIATRRLAELVATSFDVRRLDTEPPATGFVAAEVKFRPERIRHYLGLRRRLRTALRGVPTAPVLWASISPVPLGHWRDLLATVPAFAPGQPVYAVLHRATFDNLFRHPLTGPTARRLVARLSGLVFLNEQLAGRCAEWVPPEKRLTIPNTIDEAIRCSEAEIAAKRARRATGAPLRLLFLSNMMPEKGYLDVLHAVALLHERGVAVEADFAGGWVRPEDRIAFEQVVAERQLARVVRHHGAVTDRDRIKALHLSADFFLLPSYHPTEAQPISLIEALNAATPIVTTRHGGMPEMVSDGREACFVPPRAPDAIAEAVATTGLDPDRWTTLSHAARRRFDEHFSPESVRRQWERLLGGGL